MQTQKNQDQHSIIEQLPGILGVMDLHGHWIGMNKNTANTMGFPTVDSIYGVHLSNVNCPVAESADDFMKQNALVTHNECALIILDIHTYANNQEKILLTNKKPYINNDKVVGTIANCTEIEHTTLQAITTLLINSDKKYFQQRSKTDRSYQINTYNDKLLTSREQDILCYVIRGKTMRQIAILLGISPRTVETHLVNLKNKLNCNSKSDLIEIGIERGYLSLIPPSLFNKTITMSMKYLDECSEVV